MSGRPCAVADCIWAENDNFCNVLTRASVPLDSKWPLVILYLRGIGDFSSLSEVQKSQMQGDIFLQKKLKIFILVLT